MAQYQKSQVFVNSKTKCILSTAYGKGRNHDFKVLKQSRCAAVLQPGTELLSDSGFQGVAKLHPNSRTPHKRRRGEVLTDEQQTHNRTLAKERILAEHVIRKLKVWRVLRNFARIPGVKNDQNAHAATVI